MIRVTCMGIALILLAISARADLYAPMGETVGALVRDGQAIGRIVTAADASAHEQAAAAELQAYLTRISGAEVPVMGEDAAAEGFAVFVGRTNFARQKGLIGRAEALGDEGLLMYADEDGAALLGPDDLGTLYAVYAFLEEKLGVRWFNPDPLGEVVPSLATIEIGRMDEAQTPDLRMRWIGRGEWALRSRQNVGLPDESLGMKIFRSAHTFRTFIPPEEQFEEHPEWFAEIGGERRLFEGNHRNQFCTSNPEVIEATVAAMRRTLDEDPDIDVITLFPNDGLGFCECADCVALDEATEYSAAEINGGWAALGPEKQRTLSRRMTLFYDACARELLKSHPDRFVKTGIYSAYLLAPLDQTLSVPENTTGQLCHGWCHNHAISDPDCEVNADFRASMEAWGRIYPSLCLYEYYYKVAALELPFPIIHAMREDIPWLRDAGVFGIYTQYSQNWWTIGLNYYIASKLVWDADLDVDALLDDYYRKMYADAWEPMRDYHEAYEQAAIASDVHLSADYAQLPLIFTDELLAQQRERLARAQQLAEGDDVRARVAKQEVVLGYVQVSMDYMNAVLASARELADARWVTSGEPDPELDARAEDVRAYLEAHFDDNCFRDRISNYVERFLNPSHALADAMPYVMEGAGAVTKLEWIDPNAPPAAAGDMPETFAIWMYANDIDGEDGNPEHELLLMGPDGEYEAVATLVDEAARTTNRRNGAYVIRGLETARYIRDGKLQLRLVNLPGGWTMSTIYAFFVMPDMADATDEAATGLVEGDLDWVRENAGGFHEFGFRGVPSGDGAPVDVTITVTAFEEAELPE